ncbi:hypothetical protein DAPPUDRAFT_302453 [Daphnia pulex]|uniref:GDP/GTP exchange factor Sec2 N-terminal domain-containing protein n=1 Tax=Daphnia pulex TaxID=6669 RepID=E9HNC8_DAPPU|nr:hypothetical protein DAPPUDRAFT_302453 [Daphnia pulex]|eukprot:EFX66735.1 hypothetical protein DAPPUDRAFT_302453 [Daphnia pulex]
MGLSDIMAQPEPMPSGEVVGVVTGHHVPSHSRESSTSSTASAASICSNGGLIQTAEEEEQHTSPIYTALSKCSSPTANNIIANHSVELARDAELEQRLEKTRLELEQSRAECGRLAQIRDDVEAEVRELTASLFQEAHVMVNAANVKAAASEKALKEARMQVEVLSAEVEALKTLVLTSTPSQPNAHLHPQLSSSLSSGNIHTNNTPPSLGNGFAGIKSSGGGGLKMFTRHRRGTSDCDMKYHHIQGGADLNSPLSSSPENPVRPAGAAADACCLNGGSHLASTPDNDGCEVDPVLYDELENWRKNPSLEQESSPLMQRLFEEDADRCLDFPQKDLAARVRLAVQDNVIFIEEFATQSTRCALLDTQRQCRYRIKLGDDDQWHTISSLCRNRITAVCDMLTYLRYIQLGLVKSSVDDIYWEMIRLRKRMTLARLGLS